MKKFLCSFGIATLAISSIAAPNSFAESAPIFTGKCYDCEYKEDPLAELLREVPKADPLAEEVISLFENTFKSDFTADINLAIQIDGENYDWDDNKTAYSIGYDAGNASVTKKENAYDIQVNNESLSVFIDGKESYYPIDLDISFSEKAILDFDTFQFAGSFSIGDIDTHGNESLQNIVEGILEFVELFEDKWIVVDFLEIEEEFPELISKIEEMKNDITQEIGDEMDIYNYATVILTDALLNGYATVDKYGDTYTISFTPNTGDYLYISEENPLQIIVTTKNNKTITSVSIAGNVEEKSSWDDDNATFSIIAGVHFSNNSQSIVFPTISEEDFEITNIIEMVLEFTKDDILEEGKKRAFFDNLNAFQGNVDEALIFLEKNGTENDAAFLEEYTTVTKKWDRRIRLKDLRVLESYYNIDDWETEYLADDLAYSPYRTADDASYVYKNAFEELIETFAIDQKDYVYIPWNVYDEMNFPIKKRGDIVIALAKVRKAELVSGE